MKLVKIVALGAALAYAVSAGAALAAHDPVNGKKVYKKCKICHSMKAGKNKMGPSLSNVLGRKAGEAKGFKKYSKAMKGSGVVWTEDSLAEFVAKPKAFIKGNKMKFRGVKKEHDRQDLILYLKEAGG